MRARLQRVWSLSSRRSGGEQHFWPRGTACAEVQRHEQSGIFWKEYSWIIMQNKEGEEGLFSPRNKGGRGESIKTIMIS